MSLTVMTQNTDMSWVSVTVDSVKSIDYIFAVNNELIYRRLSDIIMNSMKL